MTPLLPSGSPRLGLGLAALGRPGYINLGHAQDLGAAKDQAALEARSAEVLDVAWAAGVRYFDAARSYGLAEAFLGRWLRSRGHRAVVGSKWGYTYVAGWQPQAPVHEVKDHRLATLERQWPETVTALARQPDLYLIHSATLETGVLDDPAVLARLADLAAQGLRVGLSTSGAQQAATLRRALEVRVGGVAPFSAVQATWNVLEPSAAPALAEAHAQGWSVVVKEALANGRLSARGLSAQGDVPAPLQKLAAEQGVTPDAVALAAALAQPWADVVLSGASTTDQLRSNLKALELVVDPTALQALAQPAAAYWADRAALAWT